MTQNYFILTGPPGAGKTALLNVLSARNVTVVPEPARRILAEQRSFDGPGVPDADPALFSALLLSRAVDDHRRRSGRNTVTFFDRGIPDCIAYARLFGVDDGPARRAAGIYQYNSIVFFAPPWRDIYGQDDERKMTFDQASQFGGLMYEAYCALGHTLVELPLSPLHDRADFVLDKVRSEGAIIDPHAADTKI